MPLMPGTTGRPASSRVAALVPVKAFHLAKGRLAGVLGAPERAALARRMAAAVVRAASPLPVAVVCDDEVVADWARAAGATVIWRPQRGLNPAVQDAFAVLGADGFTRVIVAHADLPLARDLSWLAEGRGVTIVPDRREDGTNVLSVPTGSGFTFAYGAGSFARHREEAARVGLALDVVRDPQLGWDVDLPDDLDGLERALESLG
jgi:2-phospho-L-lactate guanylyltransferase